MSGEKIQLYTAAFGDYGGLVDTPYRGICFTDKQRNARGWEYSVEKFNTLSPIRCARQHKILSHMFFPGVDYTIWTDANIVLAIPPEEFVDRTLKEHDLAIFAHSKRSCVYDELLECIAIKIDDPKIMTNQINRYEMDGYPTGFGLVESGVIVRRDTPQVRAFNRAWWAEIVKGSYRDQLSFNYVCWKLGFEYDIIPGSIYTSDLVRYNKHK